MNQAGDQICPEKAVPRVADSKETGRKDHVVYTEIMYGTLKSSVLPNYSWDASGYTKLAGGWQCFHISHLMIINPFRTGYDFYILISV